MNTYTNICKHTHTHMYELYSYLFYISKICIAGFSFYFIMKRENLYNAKLLLSYNNIIPICYDIHVYIYIYIYILLVASLSPNLYSNNRLHINPCLPH